MRKRSLFLSRQFYQWALLAFILGLIALLIGPFHSEANRRAEAFKNTLFRTWEESLGVTVQYESISPALFSALSLRNFSVSFEGGSFKAQGLQVYINPWRFFSVKKDDPFRLISRVVLEEGHFDGRFSPQNFSLPSANPDPALNLSQFFAQKEVVLKNFSAKVDIVDHISIYAHHIFLSLEDQEGNVRYRLTGQWEASEIQELPSLGMVKTNLSAQGIFSPQETDFNGRFDFLSTQSALLVLPPTSIDLSYNQEGLILRRIEDEQPLNWEWNYQTSDKTWEMTFHAADLHLREVILPTRPDWDPWFSAVLDGEGMITGKGIEELGRYTVAIDVNNPPGVFPWPWQTQWAFSGEGSDVFLSQVNWKNPFSEFHFDGSFDLDALAPSGRLDMDLEDSLLGYPLQASFDLVSRDGLIMAEPDNFQAAGLQFDDFRLMLIREAQSYALSFLLVPEQAGDQRERSVLLDVLFDYHSQPVLQGFLTVEGVKASYFSRLSGLDDGDLLSNILLNFDGSFEVTAESWFFTLNDAMLVQEDNPENQISWKGEISSDYWSLDRLESSWNGFTMDARAYAERQGGQGEARGQILVQGKLYPLEAQWYQNGKIEILSEQGLSILVAAPSLRGRAFQLKTDLLQIPLQTGWIEMEWDLRGRLAKNDWELYVNTAKIALKEQENFSDMALEWTGTISPGLLNFPNIRFVDKAGQLEGNARAEWGEQWRSRISFLGKDQEAYEINLMRQGDQWDGNLSLSASPLNRFFPERLGGVFNAKASFLGTLKDPLITLEVESLDSFLDNHPLDARAAVVLENRKLRIQDIVFESKNLSLSHGLILFDLSKGAFRGTSEIELFYQRTLVSTGISLALDFDRPFSLGDWSELLSSNYEGSLALEPILWNSVPHLPALSIQFLNDENHWLAQTPGKEILDLSYDYHSGDLQIKSNDVLPIMLEGGGIIKEGQMDLSFPLVRVDPVLLNYVMPYDPILQQQHVVFQDGKFDGNLDIRGALSNPDFYGKLYAPDLKVDTPYTNAAIGRVGSTIRFEGNSIIFDRIDVPVGDGFVYGWGSFFLDSWSLSAMDMVYGSRSGLDGVGVPVSYPLFSVYLEGSFTGEVRMRGDGEAFWLDGDLTFPFLKASLASSDPLLDSNNDTDTVTPVFLDFNIITGPNCTFFLPNEELKIVEVTAEPGEIINLFYNSSPSLFSLTGELIVRSGDIFYFDRDFQIKEGSMTFNESLDAFNPNLAFQAESLIYDNQGEEITVALIYDAPIISDLIPRIETFPARSELEVLALFGEAIVPFADTNTEENSASTVPLALSGLFLQIGLIQPIESALKEGLDLDTVSIRTDILENALAKGLLNSSNVEGTPSSLGLSSYLDNTSLSVGKYLGDSLFLSGSLTANYFENAQRQSTLGDLSLTPTFGLEMQTPFFNVAWAFSPNLSTPNVSLVASNEFTLEWAFSY